MARIVVRGGSGPDSLIAPNGLKGDRYFLAGLGGNDFLNGDGSGNDTLVGGGGMDTLWAGRGSDRLIGNAGADHLRVKAFNSDGLDYASGGSGPDRIDLTLGLGDAFPASPEVRSFDTLVGGGGRDFLVLQDSSIEFTFKPRGTQGWRIDLETERIFDPVLEYDVAQIKKFETVLATRFDDTLKGWFRDEVLYGSFGNDLIEGGDGADTLIGPSGRDTLLGGDGEDVLIGGFDLAPLLPSTFRHDDIVSVDVLRGGKEADFLVALGPSILRGEAGHDILRIWAYEYLGKTAQLFGGGGNDRLAFGAIDPDGKTLGSYGRQEDQQMAGVLFDGGPGIDTADFSTVANNIGVQKMLQIDLTEDTAKAIFAERVVTLRNIENVVGSDLFDQIDGDNGANVIEGGEGNDTLHGHGGRDVIAGNHDNDTITGGARDDTLSGGDGADEIKGQGGDDEIKGGPKGDRLYGGPGNDTINGGGGGDLIVLGGSIRDGKQEATGGKGEDTFVLNREIGEVTITDFDARGRLHDRFDLRPLGDVLFGDLTVLSQSDGSGVRIFLDGSGLNIDLPGVSMRHLDVEDFIV